MKTSLVAFNHPTHGLKADLLTLTFSFQGRMWQVTWDDRPYVYYIGIVEVESRYYAFDWYSRSEERLYLVIPHTEDIQ